MNLIKRLVIEDDGQGMVEYTLVVLMAALVFWVGVKSTNVGDHLAKGWVKILDCVTSPLSCAPTGNLRVFSINKNLSVGAKAHALRSKHR
jgi:Flp pilus assembly pilin Flp